MTAPGAILTLAEKFDRNREAYRSPEYNETQLRREFLDPFFTALGWDVENTRGYAEAYKDVIHEDAIKIGTATKAPDYSFRIGGVRKFFVEAKKPSVNLKDDTSPAYQLRRYAWSAKLPLSILTDFEEFVVYDCRVKPFPGDKPSNGRTLYIPCTEYETRWDEIAGVFSKEAVLQGSFDKYAQTNKVKKGTAEVDDAFLKEIEEWRKDLAANIALRNPKLTQRELNFAVQRTIDRMIFLRICEDRGIETYGALMALQNGANIYKRLREVFYRADEKYNSGLFHFQKEKNRGEEPDELTLSLAIDDKPLKDIIKNLYYPESPYEFSVLPADILGQVYEQFLGKVIRLTSGHRAVVEDKPEVKKAGGVYYTPTYIVEYIVKNTVGKILGADGVAEGDAQQTPKPRTLNPKQASRLRILDPACGSGSFLIGAYQYLLDWHRDWYVNDGAEKWTTGKSPTLYQTDGGEWRLTTTERKRILLNNIYGVDIDAQAVETTKLSLLLKVLEGENEQTISHQLKMFHERALPDLGDNIKCGNSLIGPDFYSNDLFGDGTDDERTRINAFDWNKEFKKIMVDEDGFDVVIGNPPYVRIQAMKEWAPAEVEFYKGKYISASSGNYDIYVVFVEKGLGLLNSKGVLGFILPHKFFNAQYGALLRELISKGKHLSHVIHFGDQQVFEGATTYTSLMFLQRAGVDKTHVVKVDDLLAWRTSGQSIHGMLPTKDLTASEWNLVLGGAADLLKKLNSISTKLEDATTRIFQGIKTSADKIYIIEELQRKGKRVKVFSPEKQEQYWIEPDLLHPLIKGGDSRRYSMSRTNRMILFPYAKQKKDATELVSENVLKTDYPLTWEYLKDNKTYLENREDGKMRGLKWYAYGRNQALDVMPLPKIFTPDIAARASFSLDESGEAFFTGGVAGGYGILVAENYFREYVLGLLNSKLLEWVVRQTATQMRGGYYSFESRFIRSLPIRTINFSDPADKSRHDTMVELVERMLDLNKKLAAATIAHDKTTLQRQIDSTDKQIDDLVYELYGLTQEEITIVEGSKA